MCDVIILSEEFILWMDVKNRYLLFGLSHLHARWPYLQGAGRYPSYLGVWLGRHVCKYLTQAY